MSGSIRKFVGAKIGGQTIVFVERMLGLAARNRKDRINYWNIPNTY